MGKRERVGVVYSTNPDFKYEEIVETPKETLAPNMQNLRVVIDRKGRAGKTVTLVTGFVGTEEDAEKLAKSLKNRLGVGGSAKEGEILIQGDHREKVLSILRESGYLRTK